MAIYIPESIKLRIGSNTIHGQNLEKARQLFWPSEIQFRWDGQRSLLQTQGSQKLLPLIQTLVQKMIRELQYPTRISLRLEGLGSRLEQIDEHRILFKLGRSHAYYLRLPSEWKVQFLTPRVCWMTGPNSAEVSLLIEILKRYKRMDRSNSQGFLSSKVSLPRLSEK